MHTQRHKLLSNARHRDTNDLPALVLGIPIEASGCLSRFLFFWKIRGIYLSIPHIWNASHRLRRGRGKNRREESQSQGHCNKASEGCQEHFLLWKKSLDFDSISDPYQNVLGAFIDLIAQNVDMILIFSQFEAP